MLRHALLTAILLLAACAGPKPCTRTLCVSKLEGTMELEGWGGTVTQSSETPKPPVMSDTVVTVLAGSAEFVNGKTKVTAAEGSSFKFSISTRAVSAIEVSSGAVSATNKAGTRMWIEPGATFFLPKP